MASLKASQHGLIQIKQAIAQKGWPISSERWLLKASKVLEPKVDWQASGPFADGCSASTWERFVGGIAIRKRSFVAFCQILGLNPNGAHLSRARNLKFRLKLRFLLLSLSICFVIQKSGNGIR